MPKRPHEALLTFSFGDHATADAVARALAPEASQTALDGTTDPSAPRSPQRASEVPKTRGEVSVVNAATLRIELHAEDLPSLRATVNSHLRWVDAAARAARLGRS